ncbi:MAG: hypothetical protein AAGB46_00560 [Verrucomicrobiota bacterium]
MFESNLSIQCEITAADQSLRKELKQIARTCAIDLKLAYPIETLERSPIAAGNAPEISFSIPAQLALACDAIWDLACRVALFCPNARITTQIESD